MILPEEIFHDMSLHAMEAYPEYFGTLPVPYHTSDGYTLRYRTLANGIYWLEVIPPPDGKHVIGMFPGEGTDFLLLK